MDAVIAIETDLNAIVKEYLDYLGYRKTSSTFEEELLTLGKQLSKNITPPRSNSNITEIQQQMMVAFEDGEYSEFFRMWNRCIPDAIQETDEACHKLVFNMNIFFALHPITHGNQNKQDLEKSMREFKCYLETKGAALSQTTEFLPYYALPYIPDPTSHPSFKPLFTADYHKLIGIAAELVDSLEDTVRGRMVTPEYLQNICTRLFAPSNGESVDISKPGTASSLLRASLAHDGLPRLSESIDIPLYKPSLDYEKIKNDLLTLPERKRAFLLQALRWNITQAPTSEDRDTVVSTYIVHDLLGCSVDNQFRKGILSLLSSPSEEVREYLSRLFNALASLSAGRSYLAQNPSLVHTLLLALTKEPKNSLTSENMLGTLQKLSLRRQMQSIMIEGDLIRWLSQLLSDHDNLSDYTLEYSVALLMNLCLRSAGKRRCLRDAGHILRIMSDLLGHENQEIRPYVNGTLYSILALPAVKEEARALGMEEILNCFLKDDNPDMTRQIQFIIQQLNSDDPSATNEPESDDEDEDEDDDEGDAIDADLDKQEVLEPKEGELCGDELLSLHYSLNSISPGRPKSKKRILGDVDPNHPLTRPTTPGTRGADTATQVPGIAAKETSLQPKTAAISRAPQQQSRPTTSSKSRSGPRPTSNKGIKRRETCKCWKGSQE
ncbi:lisH domain-containing protein ARMC9-like isoform X2 [Acropora millepora]|uniref:lisH domain-containing protein ARMC9-like isoform X2 n=1 Tax=Acropora millepora TaxID=45264 RepID=UPI001CF10431|nr:lisH domain-containing protein ARMC9-like isoform X2 [Acropora millepora]